MVLLQGKYGLAAGLRSPASAVRVSVYARLDLCGAHDHPVLNRASARLPDMPQCGELSLVTCRPGAVNHVKPMGGTGKAPRLARATRIPNGRDLTTSKSQHSSSNSRSAVSPDRRVLTHARASRALNERNARIDVQGVLDVGMIAYRRCPGTSDPSAGGRSYFVQLHHHADELCQRTRLHLLHDPRPVNLDSSVADAQVASDHLVGPPAGH